MHYLEIGLDDLLGNFGRFLDRLALGGNARQLGHEDAEAAFGLRLQDDLVLALDVHGVESSAAIALETSRCKPESAAIPANPCASPRFQAPVPEIGADFGGGWKAL